MERSGPRGVRCVREAWDSVPEPQEPRQTSQHRGPWAPPLPPGLGRLPGHQQGLSRDPPSAPCGLLRQHCPLHRPSAQSTASRGPGLPPPEESPTSQEPETSRGAAGDPTSKTQEPETQEPLLSLPDPGPWSDLLHSMLCHLLSHRQDSGACGLRPEDCLLQSASRGGTEPPTPHPEPKSPEPETPRSPEPETPPGVSDPTSKTQEPEMPPAVEAAAQKSG